MRRWCFIILDNFGNTHTSVETGFFVIHALDRIRTTGLRYFAFAFYTALLQPGKDFTVLTITYPDEQKTAVDPTLSKMNRRCETHSFAVCCCQLSKLIVLSSLQYALNLNIRPIIFYCKTTWQLFKDNCRMLSVHGKTS